MSSLTAQIVGTGGGSDDHLKVKGGIFNCLDDILMAHETAIVLPPGRDLSQIHPIVLVEPKIEIKVELKDCTASEASAEQQHQLIENLLQVPEVTGASHKKSKSNSVRSGNGSMSPHSQCSNDSTSSSAVRRQHHHHRHHHQSHNTDTNKENVPSTGLETVDEDPEGSLHRHHHHHHHRHGHTSSGHHHNHTHHHHHHHQGHTSHSTEHTHNNHHKHSSSTTAGNNGSVVSTVEGSVAAKPEQVLRKYIIKKITIRKQDGSTKKIVIKKPVDEPNAPVRLTKVVYDGCR